MVRILKQIFSHPFFKGIFSLSFTDPARVAFTPTIQYLPLHLSGIIHCHIESNPPYQFITWTKDKRIFDPFDHEGMQSLTNGSLFITKVRYQDHRAYTFK
jgi:hypothetical protein